MLNAKLYGALIWRRPFFCPSCSPRYQPPLIQLRRFTATSQSWAPRKKEAASASATTGSKPKPLNEDPDATCRKPLRRTKKATTRRSVGKSAGVVDDVEDDDDAGNGEGKAQTTEEIEMQEGQEDPDALVKTLKEALIGGKSTRKSRKGEHGKTREHLEISVLYPHDLQFEPIDVDIPPIPMLSYGLDRVLFNPGVYLLQDPKSRVYNFDPYLEKIMPVHEFDFDALSEYKTSSKDDTLLKMTKELDAKITGSTSSMSGILSHFHFVLSGFRELNHSMLSREFPEPSPRFSKITLAPSAVFLRYRNGIYAIDADKTHDSPNIMSWLGNSLEKLLTTDRSNFELYRRSSLEKPPAEDKSSRCYHYSKQGNLLMRSQLDAVDPRLPGSGVFDLKTRAVVSIRMNHKDYAEGSGYQLRKARGEWESFEREFYDMTRATLLKYSLQVRMGRMDGIFIAFHNVERIFGFQYLSLSELDAVLHGQHDLTLGDQEFKLSIALLDELLIKAIAQFPETSIRLHFESRDVKTPFMYIFAEPVTEEEADFIQSTGEAAQKKFARTVVEVGKDDPEVQAAWQDIQDEVDEHVGEDESVENPSETWITNDEEELHMANMEDFGNAREVGEDETSEDIQENDSPEDTIEAHDENIQGQQAETEADPENDVEASNEEHKLKTTEKAELPSHQGPLMGWTLTIRNKVNGGYVYRPEKLDESDEWNIEYHIQEIPEATRGKLYAAVQKRRRALIGHSDENVPKELTSYRELIQRYTERGRVWRKEQDEKNETKGAQLYKPMGPGSEIPSEGRKEDPVHY